MLLQRLYLCPPHTDLVHGQWVHCSLWRKMQSRTHLPWPVMPCTYLHSYWGLEQRSYLGPSAEISLWREGGGGNLEDTIPYSDSVSVRTCSLLTHHLSLPPTSGSITLPKSFVEGSSTVKQPPVSPDPPDLGLVGHSIAEKGRWRVGISSGFRLLLMSSYKVIKVMNSFILGLPFWSATWTPDSSGLSPPTPDTNPH